MFSGIELVSETEPSAADNDSSLDGKSGLKFAYMSAQGTFDSEANKKQLANHSTEAPGQGTTEESLDDLMSQLKAM